MLGSGKVIGNRDRLWTQVSRQFNGIFIELTVAGTDFVWMNVCEKPGPFHKFMGISVWRKDPKKNVEGPILIHAAAALIQFRPGPYLSN